MIAPRARAPVRPRAGRRRRRAPPSEGERDALPGGPHAVQPEPAGRGDAPGAATSGDEQRVRAERPRRRRAAGRGRRSARRAAEPGSMIGERPRRARGRWSRCVDGGGRLAARPEGGRRSAPAPRPRGAGAAAAEDRDRRRGRRPDCSTACAAGASAWPACRAGSRGCVARGSSRSRGAGRTDRLLRLLPLLMLRPLLRTAGAPRPCRPRQAVPSHGRGCRRGHRRRGTSIAAVRASSSPGCRSRAASSASASVPRRVRLLGDPGRGLGRGPVADRARCHRAALLSVVSRGCPSVGLARARRPSPVPDAGQQLVVGRVLGVAHARLQPQFGAARRRPRRASAGGRAGSTGPGRRARSAAGSARSAGRPPPGRAAPGPSPGGGSGCAGRSGRRAGPSGRVTTQCSRRMGAVPR